MSAEGARTRPRPVLRRAATELLRMALLTLLAALALQLYFLARVALMVVVDPASTSFQRSEAWRLLVERRALDWHQTWVDASQVSPNLKRAVIASEDAGFSGHRGVEWEAIERAWQRNQQAESRLDRLGRAGGRPTARLAAPGRPAPAPAARPPAARPEAKIIGASTITQQLAKNLFLGSERTLLRKAQELAITLMLEAVLTKARILEIYLNEVEWGEGVFGAEAASRHYFNLPASALSPGQAARLAVMLPAPKRFQTRPASPYVAGRAATIAARMGSVALP